MLSAAEIAEPELCKVSEPARPALGARDDMGDLPAPPGVLG